MYPSKGPGIGITTGLAYTGIATGFYLFIALAVIVAGLLLLRASKFKKGRI